MRWLRELFPEYVGMATHGYLTPFSEYHLELLSWVQRVPGERAYAVYVSDTQTQAEQHVENIGAMLGAPHFADAYPEMANRALGRFGSVRGWRRTRLWTQAGWTVDAAGLDRGMRGARRENIRPRLIVFDDLDRENDSPTVTQRKRRNLTRSILPTSGPGCAFMGVQNLVVRGGIFTELADGTADYLIKRTVSGPHPALRNFDPLRDLKGREDGGWEITGGESTWAAMPRTAAPGQPSVQGLLDTYGLESFLIEVQQRLTDASDLIFGQFSPDIHAFAYAQLPTFVRYYGGLDFGGEGDGAHYSSVVLLGLTAGNRVVLLYEWYGRGANVEERQMNAIEQVHAIFGRGIRWTQDGDERTYFQTLRRRAGMALLRMASRVPNSAKNRRRQFGFLLNVQGDGRPRFYYLDRQMTITGADGSQHTIGGAIHSTPQGEQRGASRFRYEIERWKRKAVAPGEPYSDEPVEIDDDVLVAVLYAAEGYTVAEDLPQGQQSVSTRR